MTNHFTYLKTLLKIAHKSNKRDFQNFTLPSCLVDQFINLKFHHTDGNRQTQFKIDYNEIITILDQIIFLL